MNCGGKEGFCSDYKPADKQVSLCVLSLIFILYYFISRPAQYHLIRGATSFLGIIIFQFPFSPQVFVIIFFVTKLHLLVFTLGNLQVGRLSLLWIQHEGTFGWSQIQVFHSHITRFRLWNKNKCYSCQTTCLCKLPKKKFSRYLVPPFWPLWHHKGLCWPYREHQTMFSSLRSPLLWVPFQACEQNKQLHQT